MPASTPELTCLWGQHPHKCMRAPFAHVVGPRTGIKGLLIVGLGDCPFATALGQEQVSVEAKQAPSSLPVLSSHSFSEPEPLEAGLLWKDSGPRGSWGGACCLPGRESLWCSTFRALLG